MAKLELSDIADLREYEREREAFRGEVIALKRLRRVGIGPLVTGVFENRTTMRFQVQEMARAERIITEAAIEAELEAYNPLIPERGELSLTVFIELTTDAELREWLPKLVGIERAFSLLVGDLRIEGSVDPEHAASLTRTDVTASVHYVRFRLDDAAQRRFESEDVVLRIDHPAYRHERLLDSELKASILADWAEEPGGT